MQNRWIHFAAAAGLVGCLVGIATAQHTQPWTLKSARAELSWRPDDPYMRFVVAQLAQADEEESKDPAAEARRRQRQQALARSRNADLFNIFSGALAVQESLQLDAMAANLQAESGEATIATNCLQGPTVKSHPWKELLGGQTPDVSSLAMCVPADQLFVRFRSIGKLLQMQDLGEQYATYVTTQTKKRAYKANRIDEINKQLALEVSPILAPVYDAAVTELAVTTSDLYFVDGNDITVIMQLRESRLLRSQLDMMLANAMKANRAAVKQNGNYMGVPYDHVHTPDRTVHVFSAFPRPDLHVRSNSLAAMQRTISTILGEAYLGETIEPLGATDEFRYIRTLMPLGDEQEDGIMYMSDAFIRKVIGPDQKLTQRARLICKSQLQMITFASLLYQTQYGQKPTSLQQLKARGCLGNTARPIELTCPGGGEYSLADDGVRGCCSHHGCFHALKPANEAVRRKVTELEAKEYQQFVQAYSEYWTTFFDPIAIRIQHDPKQTRVETIVLPLINNSIYQGLASTLGGEPEDLSPPRVTESTVFSVAARINKHRLLPPMGIIPAEPLPEIPEKDTETQQIEQAKETLLRLSSAMLNFESTMRYYPPKPRATGGPEDNPSGLSWRVQILPFLDQQDLFNQFRQNEPWDSEHNRKLITKMPDIFRITPSGDAGGSGKTRFVRPFHADAVHSSHTRGNRIATITDGTSNTLLTVIANKDEAVVWTKPDDIAIDMTSPLAGWSDGLQGHLLVGMAGGSVGELRRDASDEQIRALLTRSSGEVLDRSVIVRFDRIRSRRSSRNPLSSMPGYEQLDLPEFLYKGIGNQVAVHVCDADPLIDFNVARFLGMVGGSFNGRGNTLFGETGMFAILAMSMNSPVYISIPVTDADITDRFLTRFDNALMIASQENSGNSFFEVELDSYRFADQANDSVRAFAFRFGPLTWRFYWSRIGDGLYIASKPNIIRDLQAAGGVIQAAEPAHGAVRVRPKNWKAVLASYQIGWAESERLACLNNLGLLADLARAVDSGAEESQLELLARQVFRAEYECPCGGAYAVDSDGAHLHCSVHGSPSAPRQPSQTGVSAIRKLTQDLDDVQFQIQFLEDGLHATVTIKRD